MDPNQVTQLIEILKGIDSSLQAIDNTIANTFFYFIVVFVVVAIEIGIAIAKKK